MDKLEKNTWKPKMFQDFYVVGLEGVHKIKSYNDYIDTHIKYVESGNCFETKEEALKASNK